jgi:hypothetical protein
VPNLTRGDLRTFLPQEDLTDGELDLVILLVRGWLLDDTDLTVLPDPLPDVLWAGALELAALLADNRTSLAQKTVGPTSRSWPMASQRDAIRSRIRLRYRRAAMAPQGSYPAAKVWPEPSYEPWTGIPPEGASGWVRGSDGWVFVG